MKNFVSYSVSDFVLEESFQQWVLDPTPLRDAFWQKIIAENSQVADKISKAKEIIQLLQNDSDSPTPELTNRLWDKISTETIHQKPLPKPLYEPSKPSSNSYSWMKIAASVGLFIGLLAGITWYLKSQPSDYQTAFGENKDVTLPDGSVVKLNANSNLKISKDWSDKQTREVWLTGEAFFTVTKHPNSGNAKFIVHTNHLDVEVLGTEFNVAYSDTSTNVTLNSGKIKLDVHGNDNSEIILMKPGEQVVYLANSQKTSKKEVQAASVSAWVNSRWMLESTPLSEVAAKIKQTFGLDVIITDPQLASEQMTGVIVTNNLDEVLQGISTIYSLKVTKENNQIILSK
jgi:transmembrane sensor